MEFSLSGNALKIFSRSVTCLSRIGNELVIQSSPSLLTLHTINSSRSAYQSITFKPGFFDVYTVSGTQVQCSVLLKDICSVLRTPLSNIDLLNVQLPNQDAPKVRWILNCFHGMKKSYWITCNVEPEIQHLSLDRTKLPSNFVVRPQNLNRLLGHFQTTLREITVIATEPNSLPSDATNEIGGKAVEMRSYIDPTKDHGSSLHTQLWIDPFEEFVQYSHRGNPVDITFGMKELKAFLSFCEACEVDIHFYFDKAGEPILMAPKFGLDDGSSLNFDAALVLATMLASQIINKESSVEPRPEAALGDQSNHGLPAAQERSRGNMSDNPSDHTKIWSDLSDSAARSNNVNDNRQDQRDRNQTIEQREVQRGEELHISRDGAPTDARVNLSRRITDGQASQRHPNNWVDAAEDDDDDGEESELFVQSTPLCYED